MYGFRALIDDVGAQALAQMLGVKENHVHVMKARDSIPAEYWGLLIEARPTLTHAILRRWRTERFKAVPLTSSLTAGAA